MILLTSDLHLGAGKSVDFFRTWELHKFFQYAEKNAKELVLLGDIFEFLQTDLMHAYVAHKVLIDHLYQLAGKIKVTYVVGNHDAVMAVFCEPHGKGYFFESKIRVVPEYVNKKYKLYAAHGHAFDSLNRKQDILNVKEEPTVGDHITQFAGWLEEHVNPHADDFFLKIYEGYQKILKKIGAEAREASSLVTPANPQYEKLGGDYSEYEKGVRKILALDQYEICVLGHTHKPLQKELPGGTYVNAGSWVEKEKVPTFVEVDSNGVRLRRVNEI